MIQYNIAGLVIFSRGDEYMAKLRAVLFEKPAIYWNDQKMVFPFAKMEALLYYLLVIGEATRESLAALFWGDMGDNAAKRNLRNTVYLLKKMFSVDLLITSSRAKIAINSEVVAATDLELLTVTRIAEFIEKNPGDFLEGFYCKDATGFDDWVSEKREQFRKDRISCLMKWIIKLMNHKEYTSAKGYLQRLIELDEYNESAYRVLMKIYAKEDSYKVMEIYQKLERKMAQDLGLAPSVKTQEIYKWIKDRQCSSIVKEDVLRGQRFFGREKELRQLRLWLKEFYYKDHSKQMILLQGDQGVGKSAIIEELFPTIPAENSNVFRTQCYQAEFEYMYKAWNNIFLQVMTILSKVHIHLPPLWQQVIAYVFPTAKISEKLLHEEIMVDAYKFSPTMVEEIMCEVLGKVANLKKIILIIEDIHWMDKQGWLLLWQVLRVHGKNIICIATCHTEYIQQINKIMEDFERCSMLEYLTIDRFSAQDVMKLAALRLPGINKEMQSRLYDYTGGNALFLTECLNLIAVGKDISHGSIRLNSVLKERTGNVSDNARKILEIASVFFYNVNYEVLLAISTINEFELVEALEELQQKQLLMEEFDSDRDGSIYKFYNLQIRNYVYNQMSTIRQRMFHKQVAFYLERQLKSGMQSKDVYEHILYHYTNTDEKFKILDYTIRLAEQYFCPQYEMFPELNQYYPTGYIDFRESRSQITTYLEKIKELLNLLVTKRITDARLDTYKIAYWEMSGRYHIWRGEHLLGLKLIHQMLRLASAKNFREYQIKGYQQIIYCGIQTRKAHLIREFALKLLRLTEYDELPDKKATALRFLGIAYALKGQYQQAENYYRQSLTLLKKLAVRNRFYVFTIAAANNYIGDLRRESFDYEAALHHYEQAVRIAGRKNISEGVALFYINAGYTAFHLNDDVKASAYLMDALSVADGFGDQKGYWCLRGYCTLNCVLSLIAVRQHRPYDARRYLEQAKDFLKKYNDPYQSGLIFRTQAEITLLMQKEKAIAEVFADDLPLPAVEYYKQARKIFDKLGRAAELTSLEEMMVVYGSRT
jgi:DNA-binding SARP family transcriptional activator/predicted ATPase